MTLLDLGGVVGVLLVIVAYAGAQFGWAPARERPALLMNLVGSGLILLSMTRAFNLSAFLMEAAWAGLATFGLFRTVIRRR